MNNNTKKFRYAIFIIGLFLSIATALIGETDTYELLIYSVKLDIWASVPYIIFLIVSSAVRNKLAIIGAGILMLGLDVFLHAYVLFFPGSSTDAIALLFMPIWLVVLFMPAGFFVGWLIGKAIQKFKRDPKEKKDEIFISGKNDAS